MLAQRVTLLNLLSIKYYILNGAYPNQGSVQSTVAKQDYLIYAILRYIRIHDENVA